MNCDVKKLRCASLRSALQRCGALSPHTVSRTLRARNPRRVRKESGKKYPGASPQKSRKSAPRSLIYFLECRKWGFRRWGFKEIRGYLRKEAFFLPFLDSPGAPRTLRKRAKKAEKGQKRPISTDFQEGRPDSP